MKYEVTVDGRTFVVEVDGDRVKLDGRMRPATLHPVPRTPMRQLAVDGRSRSYALLEREGGWEVISGGRAFVVTVEDERTRRLRAMAGEGATRGLGGTILAPMPGLVLRIEVELGQTVEPGMGVLVLEAMKMENEIKATGGGVVRAIHVSPGQAVEKGVPMVELSSSLDRAAGGR